MPLGGQHISAALLATYKAAGGQDNEEGIPEAMQFVDAEVLRANTPLEVCRLAAGEHQNSQRDVQGMSMADAFAFLCKTAKEKAAKMGSPYFTDNEVAMAGRQLGLQKFRDRHGNELSETQSVCNS